MPFRKKKAKKSRKPRKPSQDNTASDPTHPRCYTGYTNAATDYEDTEHEPGYLQPIRKEPEYETIDSHNDVTGSQVSQADYTTSTPDYVGLYNTEGENEQTHCNDDKAEYEKLDKNMRENMYTSLA